MKSKEEKENISKLYLKRVEMWSSCFAVVGQVAVFVNVQSVKSVRESLN